MNQNPLNIIPALFHKKHTSKEIREIEGWLNANRILNSEMNTRIS